MKEREIKSAVDRGVEPRYGQTKDYTIGMCCFSAKHTTLTRKSKDWLARNQDNMIEWGDRFMVFNATAVSVQRNTNPTKTGVNFGSHER
jgi:hypothetical protein